MPKRIVLGKGYPILSGNNKFCCRIGLSPQNKMFNKKDIRFKNTDKLELPWPKNNLRGMDEPMYYKIELVAYIIKS